jgi:hypothetical protein
MDKAMRFYESCILDLRVLFVLDILFFVVVIVLLVGPFRLAWGKSFLAIAVAYLGVRSLSFLVWRIWLELPAPD